jgi:hypothetical protein
MSVQAPSSFLEHGECSLIVPVPLFSLTFS